MGLVKPTPEFLSTLREMTDKVGALLIFDEVMTGFRLSYGGAQQLCGVQPDLTTLGKIVGGGLPVGAYGGRAEIMNHVLPEGKVFQAGTLSGNPLAMAAGIATLKLLRADPPYDKLERHGKRLASGLSDAATAAKIPHTVARVGSMLTLFFNPDPVTDWPSAAKCDTQQFAKFFWGLIDRGVYFPCSQYEALFISAAHSDRDIEHTIQAAKEALAEIAEGREVAS
jgi:glutamate-1-semialdehyde 2,1-aminomutase